MNILGSMSKSFFVFFISLLLAGLGAIPPAVGQEEGGWPVQIKDNNRTVVMYQPEPETLADRYLSARAAIAVITAGEEEPVFGAAWFQARLSVDRTANRAVIQEIDVSRVKFPESDDAQETRLARLLTENFPKSKVSFVLDKLQAELEIAAKEQATAEELATAPPRIIFTSRPSVLVTLDGPPELKPVDRSNIMQVVNTPFFICYDPSPRKYYLKGGPQWFSAPDISGPWSLEANVPKAVVSLGSSTEEDEDQTAVDSTADAPRIIVVTEPTELIVTDGDPTYTPISGTSLMYVSNTDSNIFLDMDTRNYYVLLAGRWYQAGSLNGPWQYTAADRLPEGFEAIPDDSSKVDVLASVAGTEASQEAVIEAAIPQTTVIKRDQTPDLEVTYDGRPRFDPIEDTDLKYAANTAYPVIMSGNRYYACYEAAWYISSSPYGPWTVAAGVPLQIYAIPPSCPVYYVKFVRIYHVTPKMVYVGYLPGYTGTYVYGPTVVYGTGYHYRGWHGAVYYPRQVTWGFHATYSFDSGGWDFGFGFGVNNYWYRPLVPGGGWFVPGFGAGFVTGAVTTSVVHQWWGPGGWPGPALYRPRPAVFGQPGYRSPFRYPGSIYHRPKNRHRNVYADRKDISPGYFGPTQPGHKPGRNDIYTDRDGNVYRFGPNGWQKQHQGRWQKIDPTRLPRDFGPAVKPISGFKPGRRPDYKPGHGVVPPGPGLKPGTKPDYKPGPGIVMPGPGHKPGTKPDFKPDFKPGPGVVPPGPGLKPGTKPDYKPGPGIVMPGPGHKPGTKPDFKPDFKPGPGIVQPGPGFKPGTKPDYKPGPGIVQPGPGHKPGTKPDFKPGPGIVQPGPGFKPGTKPDFKPGPGIVQPGPGFKPGAKPGAKPDYKPGQGVVPLGPGLKPGTKPDYKPSQGVAPSGPGLKTGTRPGNQPNPVGQPQPFRPKKTIGAPSQGSSPGQPVNQPRTGKKLPPQGASASQPDPLLQQQPSNRSLK